MGYRKSNAKKYLIDCPKSVLRLIIYPKRFINESKTYYPEKEHKGNLRAFFDQLRFALKYGYNNDEYYIYGQDIKGTAKEEEFVPENENMDTLLFQNRNFILKESKQFHYYNHLCLLRDKWIFSKLMEGFGFPIPKTIGAFIGGKFVLNGTHDFRGLEDFCQTNECDVMAKPISGNSGKGILHLKVKNSIIYHKDKQLTVDELHGLIKDDIYIIQEYITNQHPAMKNLFSGSVNTLRITMARANNEIQLLGVMCLMGARDAEFSNWHYGGVCVNVKRGGILDKYGFSFSDKRIEKHPDSGIVFEGYKIPFYEEALEMCLQAMNMFYGMKTIGWDIAFTENGPVFIEGNDGWGIAAHQMVEHRGWAKQYYEVFK